MKARTWLAVVTAVLALCGAGRAQFSYATSTGDFPIATSVPSDWSAFYWTWSDQDYQQINARFTGVTGATGVVFRLAYPEKGSYYLTIANGTLSQATTNLSWSTASAIPPSNIPPNRVYFAEFIQYGAGGVSRTLAKGRVKTDWSTFSLTNAATWTPVTVTYPTTSSITIVESDPTFATSVAHGVTATLTGEWSIAYGWGNHATNQYATTGQVAAVNTALVASVSAATQEIHRVDTNLQALITAGSSAANLTIVSQQFAAATGALWASHASETNRSYTIDTNHAARIGVLEADITTIEGLEATWNDVTNKVAQATYGAATGALWTAVTAEVARATAAEEAIPVAAGVLLTNEIERAMAAEGLLATNLNVIGLTNEINARIGADAALSNSYLYTVTGALLLARSGTGAVDIVGRQIRITPPAQADTPDYGLGVVVTNIITNTIPEINTNIYTVNTGKVSHVDATYTATVAKAASALQAEVDPSWSGGTGAVWSAIDANTTGKVSLVDATYTDAVAKAASAIQTELDPAWSGGTGAIWTAVNSKATGTPIYVESDPAWSGGTGAVWEAVNANTTGKVSLVDATYTDAVAKAGSALQTELDPAWSGGTGAVWEAVNANITGKVSLVDATYTATVAKAASAIQTDTGATNFVAASSNVNFQSYDPATRTLTYCVTNGGGGGTGDASLWYTYPAVSNVTFGGASPVATFGDTAYFWNSDYWTGTNEWTDPTNAIIADEQAARAVIESALDQSVAITVTNYDFTAHGESTTVQGITTTVKHRGWAASPAPSYVLIRYGTNILGGASPEVLLTSSFNTSADGTWLTNTDTFMFDPALTIADLAGMEAGFIAQGQADGATCDVDYISLTPYFDTDNWQIGAQTNDTFAFKSGGTTRLSVSTGGTVTATGDVVGNGIPLSAAVTGIVISAAGANAATVAGGVATVTWNTNDAGGGGGWSGGAIVNPSSFSGGLTVTNGPSGLTTNAPFEVNASTPYTPGMRIRTKLSPSGVDWTPANLTNYSVVGWFDAEWSKNYLTNDASVATWSNRVSSLSLAGLTVNPNMRYGVLNGKAALEFSGGSTLYNHSLIVKYPHSAYAVIQVKSNQTRQGVFDQSASGTGFRFELLNYTNGVWNISGGTNLSVTNTSSANVYSTNIIAVKLNASESSIRVGKFANSGSAGTSDVNGWRIGRDNLATYKFGGYVAEMLIVSNVVDDATDDIIRGYLAKKYSLQSELPDDSMYLVNGPTLDPITPVTNAFEVLDHDGIRVANIDQDGNITGNGVNLTTLKGQFDGSSNGWVKADGTVPMTGDLDFGGQDATNFAQLRGGTGTFDHVSAPAFGWSLRKSSAHTIVSSTTTNLHYDTFVRSNSVTYSAIGRATPKVPGVYILSVTAHFRGVPPNPTAISLRITKNGSTVAETTPHAQSGTQYIRYNVSGSAYFNGTTDYSDIAVNSYWAVIVTNPVDSTCTFDGWRIGE